MLPIDLKELLDLGRAINPTDAKIINQMIDAQDCALEIQRVRAQDSFRIAEFASRNLQ